MSAFNHHTFNLPVADTVDAVKVRLSNATSLIVIAPPGAGKSTLLPLTLLEEPWLAGKKIIMLEPRRLAAKTIAIRMSQMLGETVGETVGYRIRFENRIGKNTRLEVVTEGVLTRILQSDNALEEYGLVIFDEFHERSLHADLALALCREAQNILRHDLRLLIMSATLNVPHLSSLLRSEVLESKGKQYPVKFIHTTYDADERAIAELTARVIVQASDEQEGDILAFLPGEAEIKNCAELLETNLTGFRIHPLFGRLSGQEQFAAIMPDRSGKRKIVLATSIAETSLTIEGIRTVVDCGFGRYSKFDVRTGLTKLQTLRIPKDSADQRAGRAGRLSAGACYRMWTSATDSRLQDARVPEILEADLAPMMLELFAWGVIDPYSLSWVTPPPKAAVSQATNLLNDLGAIENDKITSHGKKMHGLPCHPRIAHMLLLAEKGKQQSLACDVAALIEERDPLGSESGVDISLRVEALRRYRNISSQGKFKRIEQVAESYRTMLKVNADNGGFDSHECGLLLAYAYPERIASARPGNNAPFQLSNGKVAAIGHKDSLAHEPWLAVAHMDMRETLGKIFLAAPLNPKDLAPLVKDYRKVEWNVRKGGLIAQTEMRIGNLVLGTKPITKIDNKELSSAILAAVANEGAALFELDDKFQQLRFRVLSLKKWNPDLDFPDVDEQHLFAGNLEWITPYLVDLKKNEDLKKLDLSEILFNSFDFGVQKKISTLAPAVLEVPSGSKIRIEYFPNGNSPVLAVRLQEVFGLTDTPKVNGGKIPVVMHLLSPGYKPVQVTSDLKSFWSNMYFEVKRELQRRYPKHSWPEDPLKALPVAKGRSHKN